MAINNRNLHAAREEANDEFYTRLEDIENELKNYRSHFKGKTVFCNCDDPKWSNFWKFFDLNFDALGLNRLISTHYEPSTLFEQCESYKKQIIRDKNGIKKVLPDTPLNGDGDFRSAECVALLKEADIVVSNPPFTLFRDYMAQLAKYKKKFLIIGPYNAVKYTDIFPLFQSNQLWLGTSFVKEFVTPDGGIRKFGNILWYTNLTHKKRNEQLVLTQKYKKAYYPTYDNFKAIEVSKVANIPMDYKGVMGVPITFLDKYNPEQFEIIGIDRAVMKQATGRVTCFFLNKQEIYSRILIRNKQI